MHQPQLFSVNRGTEYLPSSLPTVNGTLYWSVTRDAPSNTVIIKVLHHPLSVSCNVHIALPRLQTRARQPNKWFSSFPSIVSLALALQ